MRFLILFSMLWLAGGLKAQPKFIEVNVSDTVLVKADLFVYQINFLTDDDITYSEVRSKNGKLYTKEIQRRYDSVVASLTKAGFVFLSPDVSSVFTLTSDVDGKIKQAYVMVNSVEKLDSLYHRLRSIKNLSGTVIIKKATDEEPSKSRLMRKLFDEATAKAKSLAQMAGLSVSGIAFITEHAEEPSETKGGWIAYPPLSNLYSVIPGWHTTVAAPVIPLVTDVAVSTDYVIGNGMTVRFAVQ